MSNCFDAAWALLKEFRYDTGFPGIIQQGAYDPITDTPYVNLASHVSDFKTNHPDDPDGWGGQQRVFRTDEELMERVMQIMGHENMHQALHPPYTDDLWNQVSMFGLNSEDVDEDEKARLQAKVDNDWERFQEYGAWTGTPGIDEDEKWRMLRLYGIYPKGGEP